MTMIRLYDKGSGAELGSITQEQLQFLADQLEEESIEDRDYYINRSTIDYFRRIAVNLEALRARLRGPAWHQGAVSGVRPQRFRGGSG